jgi:hypothetical protein
VNQWAAVGCQLRLMLSILSLVAGPEAGAAFIRTTVMNYTEALVAAVEPEGIVPLPVFL